MYTQTVGARAGDRAGAGGAAAPSGRGGARGAAAGRGDRPTRVAGPAACRALASGTTGERSRSGPRPHARYGGAGATHSQGRAGGRGGGPPSLVLSYSPSHITKDGS